MKPQVVPVLAQGPPPAGEVSTLSSMWAFIPPLGSFCLSSQAGLSGLRPFCGNVLCEKLVPLFLLNKWNRLILQCTDQQRSWMVTQVFWSTAGPTQENPPLTLEHSVRVSVGGQPSRYYPFEKNRCHSCHFKLTLAEKDQQIQRRWTIFDWYSVKYCMGLWSTNSPICCCLVAECTMA